MNKIAKIKWYCVIIAAVIAVDQIVKKVVDDLLAVGESVPVIENIFHLTYVRNSGAAFSMMQDRRVLLTLLPAALICILFIFLVRKCENEHPVLKLALSLIIAGGFGNLIDRIGRGYVVDMFDFRVWPVFNVADIAVCVGCGLLLIYVVFLERKVNGR
ncbi:MAG: signal peptidase II [Firmicutes bacterium]|nr:signal peptidase II [Bacillota bacterium]